MLREEIVVDEKGNRLIDAPLYKNQGISRQHIDLTLAKPMDKVVNFQMTSLRKVEKKGIMFCLEKDVAKGMVLMVKFSSRPAWYLAVLEVSEDYIVFSDPFKKMCEAYKFGKKK